MMRAARLTGNAYGAIAGCAPSLKWPPTFAASPLRCPRQGQTSRVEAAPRRSMQPVLAAVDLLQRRVGQALRRPIEHDPSARHAEDAIGEPARKRDVVHVD